jgi:hypothetical protein
VASSSPIFCSENWYSSDTNFLDAMDFVTSFQKKKKNLPFSARILPSVLFSGKFLQAQRHFVT